VTHSDNKGVHSELGIICVLLGESRINDIVDTVDSDTSLGDIGGDDHFTSTWWCGVKDTRLHLGRQCSVDGQNEQLWHLWAESLDSLIQDFACGIDLFLTSQEEQDVSGRFHKMDLKDCDERCFKIIGLGLLGVEGLDRESSTGDRKDWTSKEEGRELGSVECGGGTDQTEVGTSLTSLCH
jgi:hypothetical protein